MNDATPFSLSLSLHICVRACVFSYFRSRAPGLVLSLTVCFFCGEGCMHLMCTATLSSQCLLCSTVSAIAMLICTFLLEISRSIDTRETY